MNEGNNNNNNFDLNTSINSEAFNVFNQAKAPSTEAQAVLKPDLNHPQTPVQPITEPKTENLITVNDYKPPKEPFSFKKLLRKKIEEDEKKLDINDISNFVEEKKSEDEILAEKEAKKKKKDIITLIVLLVILVIMGYVAYTVFSNYVAPSKDYINNLERL